MMNLINYMSSPLKGYVFLGFVPLGKDEYWGIKSGDRKFAACHLSDEQSNFPRSDDEQKERKLIDSGNHVVLYLKGNDNISYLKRFRSKDAAIKWFYKTEEFTPDNFACWVNS
ncbi:hypothetical protein phiAS5_ORF0272 [Aeromonas phage phiAS5]|uniref:Uncharacterized protein n=1 Tax=Aeromonas phage phiAS5 TaxID=879630 RepID=E1A226_9CAUD|nr:hypothetical protein phiAS5_ORF0272 [Aeromonas phage phiAS5]ADM80115.1 hypothetical protein phiAS5_ORF0272 [Aeromonas phage phiAS5]